MAVLLGLLAALCWGSGDFAGGLASRRTPETTTVFGAEVAGLVLLLAVAPFVDGTPTGRDTALAAAAGVVGVAGLVLLYRGLARGRASVVAPISAVGAALIQVGWGLATGERPGGPALVGVVLALGAIAVVAGSADPDGDAPPVRGATTGALDHRAELLCGLGAAIGFGAYLVLIAETSDAAGLWTVVIARTAPVVLLAVALPALRRRLVPRRSALALVGVAGATDAGANALLLLAVRQGLLSVVAPVANLYPAVTVLLARGFGHERIGAARLAGLGLAVASLVLISI